MSVESEVVIADFLGFQFELEGVHYPGDHHVEADEQNQFHDPGVVVVGADGFEKFVRCRCGDDHGVGELDEGSFERAEGDATPGSRFG